MTKFGLDQIGTQTPTWAKYMFGIVFLLTTVASFWAVASTLISPIYKSEIVLAFKCIDMIIYGFSEMFGVKLPERDEDNR